MQQKNPDRQFLYIEQAFFQRWWREQDEDMQAITKQLHKNGQLNFENGGWCMVRGCWMGHCGASFGVLCILRGLAPLTAVWCGA